MQHQTVLLECSLLSSTRLVLTIHLLFNYLILLDNHSFQSEIYQTISKALFDSPAHQQRLEQVA
ncbi:hypothetical protein C5B86_11915 [Haloferax sp. Atlit-19N]|nr:hypothetical protein C5B86_11915 [Haloferax sp. Atlit-19N]